MKTFKEYIINSNILYHVSNIDNLKDIQKHGILFPQFGTNIKQAYSEYYDFENMRSFEIGNSNEKTGKIYLDFPGIIFFSEKPGLWYGGLSLGSKIKWKDIILCFVKKSEGMYKYIGEDKLGYYEYRDIHDKKVIDINGTDMINTNEKPLFIERNDWFSIESQDVNQILYGDKLKEYMNKHFIEEYNRIEE